MKKFALGILSVFILLGGVLLAACERKVSLTLLTDEEIVIFTNDEQAENYGSDEIEVQLENSIAGVRAEIVRGNDVINPPTVRSLGDNRYAISVSSKENKNSGEAEVKITARDDDSQSVTVYVQVNTIIESLTRKSDDNVDARTNLFAVKGVEKRLVLEDYFVVNPETANVYNIDWTIVDGNGNSVKQLLDEDVVLAEIQNDRLLVNANYGLSSITIRATETTKGETETVDFEILENSTINEMYMDDAGELVYLYQNNNRLTDQVGFELVRNESNLSSVSGRIRVNTPYQVTLQPLVYGRNTNGQLEMVSNYLDYFSFTITNTDDQDGAVVYDFLIDALDSTYTKNVYGEFVLFLRVGYVDYNYDVMTGSFNETGTIDGVAINLDVYYIATGIDLTNQEDNIINNTSIDVFSDYVDGNGYRIVGTLTPNTVDIEGKEFYISVNLNQTSLDLLNQNLAGSDENPIDAFARFYYRNRLLEFNPREQGSEIYVTTPILDGSTIYVLASAEMFEVLNDVTFEFVSTGNSNAKTQVVMNFYEVSDQETLGANFMNEDEISAETTVFLPSDMQSERTQTYRVRIDGISTISGLTLQTDENSYFKFSDLRVVDSQNNDDETYVIVEFDVTLNGYDFDDYTNFWFEHITGRTSDPLTIQAFVPLDDVFVSNNEPSSADVFKSETASQDFVLQDDGTIGTNADYQNTSLSKLMMEAGAMLALNFDHDNASLAEEISFRFLPFQADNGNDFVSAVRFINQIGDDEEALALAEQMFADNNLNEIASDYFQYFQNLNDLGENYFTIIDGNLSLLDKEFKGFLAVVFSGYNHAHEQVSVVRFFALESFYSIRYLNSSVDATELYTSETLSYLDMGRSQVNVRIELRPDEKIPTYSNDLSFFSFKSVYAGENYNGVDFYFENGNADGSFTPTTEQDRTNNEYYTLSAISFSGSGRYLNFTITANSTNMQTQVRDILRIVYRDANGFEKETEIQISIKNVKRIESVECSDTEVYLNLTSSQESERSYTITTILSPSDANDSGLTYFYDAIGGSSNDLAITTSSMGQTFSLNINTDTASYGYLYLLPNDMIKRYGTGNHILLYKYTEDENGKIVETALYRPLSDLPSLYDALVADEDNEEFSVYFLNNDGERIYYKDIVKRISVTIADGSSEGTAIRVYSEQDLRNIDYAKYYQIMNNITLSGWETLSAHNFSGMLFGNDPSITLTFTNNSQVFMDTIDQRGVIRDLTFAGTVNDTTNQTNGGFVARVNNGLIENVTIDVYYDRMTESYLGSTLSSSATNVGGIVGANNGTLRDCNVFGLNITASFASNNYLGGLAGINYNIIQGSGVEFYNFENGESNKFVSNGNSGIAGGLAGYAETGSSISGSYVYAYSLADKTGDYSSSNVMSANLYRGAFVGSTRGGDTVRESFAFVGDLTAPFVVASSGTTSNYINSYISYINGGQVYSRIFDNKTFAYSGGQYFGSILDYELMTEADLPFEELTGSKRNFIDSLSTEVWTINGNDDVNFGFMYLTNTTQTMATDVSALTVNDNTSPMKSLYVSANQGILFVYRTTTNISDSAQNSVLTNLNTLSIADLFGITDEQASSLLLTSDSTNVVFDANYLRVVSRTTTPFEVEIHSKMDYSVSKTFQFVILNNLPQLSLSIGGLNLGNNQTIMLQKGDLNTRNVVTYLDSSIYLSGNPNPYQTQQDEYTVGFDVQNGNASDSQTYVRVIKSGNNLSLTGINNHSGNDVTYVNPYVTVEGLADEYVQALKAQTERSFGVSVYNGATSLTITDASDLTVKPAQSAGFEVVMATDNAQDNLVFTLDYHLDGQTIEITDEDLTDNQAQFLVDESLVLEVSWTKEQIAESENNYSFKSIISVSRETRHLVNKTYNFTLRVNSYSQRNNLDFEKSIEFTVVPQDINAIGISVYEIESTQIRNSIVYLVPSNEVTNVLSPSSDAILAVTVDPAYANASRFTLTYTATGSGEVGTVSIARLLFNANYGYYVNTTSTSLIQNGIEVQLTEQDKTGDGVYYFRIRISGAFNTNSDLRFNVSYYNGSTLLKSVDKSLNVDYVQSADIKVNGVSTYLMPRGSQATVTVQIGLDQQLTELYLSGNSANISLVWNRTPEIYSTYQIYTATLTAYVNATLANGKTNGVFYVNATVVSTTGLNQTPKTSFATVCLVDFAVDANNITVASSGGTAVYNGNTYDVFYSYIGDTQELRFDYPLLPEEYIYNNTNVDEVQKVEELERKKIDFLNTNSYIDEDAEFYINYRRNSETGRFEQLTLKQQLWYASSETSSSTIFNGTSIIQNDRFLIDEQNGDLMITGQRTGRQLMRLQTIVSYQGIEFVYDYYFLIVVDVWSDEEAPTQITTGAEFVEFATLSEQPDDYILMNDIVLNEYTPINTDLIDSLDGNGFTIHINSFAMPEGNALNLALFNEVTENTTLKNVRVNVHQGGHINVDVSAATGYSTINIAGFVLTNNGIIYNCEVVSYYDQEYQTVQYSTNGIIVTYTLGANTDPINLTSTMGVTSTISGFVGTNNASIMNSRVGGESFRHVVDIGGRDYLKTQQLDVFVLDGQGEVAGFVYSNGTTVVSDETGVMDGTGYISASFVDNVQIYNRMEATTSTTAGFVLYNFNNIQGSYIEGQGEAAEVYKNLTNITSMGIVAGFVYSNDGLVKNSYANIAIENSSSRTALSAGFVYMNNETGEVTLCYAACDISRLDISEMLFSGVNEDLDSLNLGTISFCYYYNQTREELTTEDRIGSGALPVSDHNQDTFYGFNFASGDETYDGIWKNTENGITLVSANTIALSNRNPVVTNNVTSFFYSRSIADADTLVTYDLSYGSENNPIIIRNAEEFAMATGRATDTEISSYKEYYNDDEVFGNYRLVNNIDLSEIDQNAENEGFVQLRTTTKTFSGLLDGNGFSVLNLNLGSSNPTESYGLFARLENAVIMNIDFTVDTVHNRQANVVGALAGIAIDSRLLSINVSPVGNQSSANTYVFGSNVVGGVVGMIFGQSKMHDINVRDIEIYSSYNGQEFNEYDSFVGQPLREFIERDNILESKISRISYAGAIAGYVDIYDQLNSDYVKFNQTLQVSDFNVVTVHVEDAIDIYGGVSGGLFGYVGNSTLIYDAGIELNAYMNLKRPSYIISRNLYAGGLIGENYGGLFAVYARYEDELQDTIETGENGYYNGKLNAEKGQQSIFSYTPNDADYNTNTNDPMFVGGLVGYMGGGYIYVGYNKLNVISHSDNTYAVGGVIGFAATNSTQFELNFITSQPQVNILLYDVYSSGDVYSDGENAVSAGIVGAMENNGGSTVLMGMKDVLAVNYYTYDGARFSGDNGGSTVSSGSYQGEYLSDRHFTVIGNILNTSSVNEETQRFDTVQILNTNLYLISSDDSMFNVLQATSTSTTADAGSYTVGGYTRVLVGQTGLNLNPYGFGVSWSGNRSIYSNILRVDSIGDANSSTMPAAYARMSTYFLPIGWTDDYWTHEENKLFPEIELLPTLDILYWDVKYTADGQLDVEYQQSMINQIQQNPFITVVLRGKVFYESPEEAGTICTDIDLTGVDFDPIENFSGTLISYYEYTNTNAMGTVSASEMSKYPGGAKVSGENVGLILDQPLFSNLSEGAIIQGVKFYLYNGQNTINFSVVENSAVMTIFRNDEIILNNNVSLKSRTIDNNEYAGLLVPRAEDTSIVNLQVKFRASETGSRVDTFNITANSSASGSSNLYFGAIVGLNSQGSSTTQVSMQQIDFVLLDEEDQEIYSTQNQTLSPININFNYGSNFASAHGGLYAGRVEKIGGSSRISMGLSRVDNVVLNISTDTNTTGDNGYFGGYVGSVSSLDSLTYSAEELREGELTSGITVMQNSSFENLYAGLAFGEIDSSTINISNNNARDAILKGSIYQANGVSTGLAQIGGIAGSVSNGSIITVQGFSIDLNVSKANEIDETYTNEFKAVKTAYGNLKPYQVTGATANFGGFFGSVNNSQTTISGTCNVTGYVDVESDNNDVSFAAGGFIGTMSGILTSNVNSENTLNISIKTAEDTTSAQTANVGGMIGNYTSESNPISINSSGARFIYTGNVLSNAKTLNFGGVIGNIAQRQSQTDSNQAVSINNTAFGGSVSVYGANIDGGNLTAGGVVGRFNDNLTGGKDPNTVFEISNCYSYGDVFVNYLQNNGTNNFDWRLANYNFGGIVGYATKMTVQNCYSLMTSFNSKTTFGQGTGNQYNVGAIVGTNAEIVNYSQNYYSSGVTMAYQTDILTDENLSDTNIDSFYGFSENYNEDYYGYSSKANGVTEGIAILDAFEDFVGNVGEVGSKLNPLDYNGNTITSSAYKLVQRTSDEQTAGENEYLIGGNSNSISWVMLSADKTIEDVISESLQNIAFVGNGYTLTRQDNKLSSEGYEKPENYNGVYARGGIVNEMSGNFSMISSLVTDLDIVADINDNNGVNAYGGIAGKTSGNAFIYATGVEGRVSVGGTSQLRLGGIVGLMNSGFINESYTDANITYRAAENGYVSGVANLQGYNAILSTYSGGQIETYINVPVYTFAYAQSNGGVTSGTETSYRTNYLANCYSYTTVVRTETNNAQDKLNYFINTNLQDDGSNQVISTFGQVFNASYDVNAFVDDNDVLNVANDMALSYNGISVADVKIGANLEDDENNQSLTTWYFSPYTNYGYASHGFAFLKNSTAFSRTEAETTEDAEETARVVQTYNYSPVDYAMVCETEDKTGFYLGVNNAGKFEQLVSSAPETTSDEMLLNFVLTHDIDMQKFNTVSLGQTVKFATLDGNNRTLNFENASSVTFGLFRDLTGNVENLRITNYNTNNVTSDFGTLATTMTGNLSNVTVTGDATIRSSVAGGVVGTLNGNATGVEALVNITSSGSSSILGGVVGRLESGTVSHSSNSGMLVNESDNGSVGVQTTVKSVSNQGNVTGDITAITGGVVGLANAGTTIIDSYNANAVLSGFTTSDETNNVAGGVVGYSSGATISNSYNTGFVGAGNYSGSGKNFAGGIVGYGTASTNISNCANDAQVEALGSMNSGNYSLTVGEPVGSENQSATKEPGSLTYTYTMTYNLNDERQVFAYGIGFLGAESGDGSISDSYSSTENIKNDGNIGQFVEEQTMTFDRQAVLDNDNGDLPFYGSFQAGADTYVNGYDSYGMPARIYRTDTITRTYGDPSQYGSDTDISKQIDEFNETYFGGMHNDREARYRAVVGSDGESLVSSVIDYEKYQRGRYNMAQTTEYYSSVSFVGYDELLDNYGLVGYVSNLIDSEDEIVANSSSTDIDENISNINQALEDYSGALEQTTIAGELTAIVKSGDNMLAAYAPIQFSGELTIDAETVERLNIDTENLAKNNFSISAIAEDVVPQITKITQLTSNQDGSIELDFTLYYATEPDTYQVNVNVLYTSNPVDIVLGRNNVEEISGGYRIYLEDNFFTLGSNYFENGSLLADYDFSVTIDNTSVPNPILRYDESTGRAYFEVAQNIFGEESLHNKILTLNITQTVYDNIGVEAEVTSLNSNSVSGTVAGETPTNRTETFDGYEDSTLAGMGFLSSDFVEGTYDRTFDLSQINNEIGDRGGSRIVFGDENYNIQYNGSGWIVGANNIPSINLEISGTTLTITSTGGTSVNTFVTEMLNSQIYYNLKDDQITLGESLQGGQILSLDSNLGVRSNYSAMSSDNRFTAGDETTFASYVDTDLTNDYNFESETGLTTHTFFGMNFYSIDVEFSFTQTEDSAIDLVNTSGQPLAFELSTANGYYMQSFLEAGGSIDISGLAGQTVDIDYNFNMTVDLAEGLIGSNYVIEDLYETDENGDPTTEVNGQQLVLGNNFTNYEFVTGEEENPITGALETYFRTTNTLIYNDGNSSAISYYSSIYTIFKSGTVVIEYNHSDVTEKNPDPDQGDYKYALTVNINSEYVKKYIIDKGIKYSVGFDIITDKGTVTSEEYTTDYEINRIQWNDNEREVTTVPLENMISFFVDFNINLVRVPISEANPDLIVSYFKAGENGQEDVVIVSKPLGGSAYTFNEPIDVLSQQSRSNSLVNSEITLTAGLEQSAEIDFTNEEFEYIDGTFEVSSNEDSGYEILDEIEGGEETFVISVDEYGENTRYYRWQGSYNFEVGILPVSVVYEEEIEYNYIILENDFSLEDEITFNSNDKVVSGKDHVIKFSDKKSLFGTTSASILNLNIVGLMDLNRITKADIAMAIDSASSIDIKLKNLTLYGNMRNVGNNAETVASLATSNVMTLSNVESNVSIVGANITQTGSSVTITDGFGEEYFSNNLLISGDGQNGVVGKDGKYNEYGELEVALPGGYGYSGGNIEISGNFNGIVRVGHAGLGGYGGNGANGYFNGRRALRGGGGAARGRSGENGTLTANDLQGESIILDNRNANTTQFGGNGGIGGFGRVDTRMNRNAFWTSGTSGTAGTVNAAGVPISGFAGSDGSTQATWKNTYTSGGKEGVAFGSTVNIGYHSDGIYGYQANTGFVVDGNWRGIESTYVKEGSEPYRYTNKVEDLYGDVEGGLVYYYNHIRIDARWYGFVWHYKGEQYRKVIWTNCDNINSGGSFAASSEETVNVSIATS